MNRIDLPVGISDFKKIREKNYYYIDKTGLIAGLVQGEPAEVTLITRPRRFGKTLGMSMLAHFFDIQEDNSAIFADTDISRNKSLCEKWMNQYPTIFLSFKDVNGVEFTGAYEMLAATIAELYKTHLYLLECEKINPYDKEIIRHIAEQKATVTEIKRSIALLSRFLMEYYGKTVILLLDEYDVPIARASAQGYYGKMLEIMQGMMGTALKDNRCLRFAVITGCLRVAKESIFTGTNNFVSDTITDSRYDEYFGFTQEDVERLLEDLDAESYRETVRAWYDGYHFGDIDVYCPWDVMNYLRDVQENPKAQPAGYWKNTSDNAIIRSFIDYAGNTITKKLEILLSGGFIWQRIDENLTYDYLHSSEENLWSVLYLTGYLTRVKEEKISDGRVALTIPNQEIREIFETTIRRWFDESARGWNRSELFAAVWNGDREKITQEMSRLLRKTISYHDYKEDFYHAFLAGIFAGAGYMVESNREHGEGRSDVIVCDPAEGRVAIFEAKCVQKAEDMEKGCELALEQISDRRYAEEFEEDYDQVSCFGIAFFKKRCLVK